MTWNHRPARSRPAIAALAMALVIAACGGGSASPDAVPDETVPDASAPVTELQAESEPETQSTGVSVTEPEPTPTEPATSATDPEPAVDYEIPDGATMLADDLYVLQHGSATPDEPITIPVGADDTSVMVTFLAADRSRQLAVTSALDPNGDSIMVDGVEAQNLGEVSLLWPMSEAAGALIPGDHEFVVATEETGIADVVSVHKMLAPDVPQQLDLQIWLATTSGVAAPDQRDALENTIREFGDATLTPHGLSTGDIDFIDAPDAIIEAFSTIDDSSPAQTLEACLEMSNQVDNDRAMNLVFVDNSVDAENPDFTTTGSAASVPGSYPLGGSPTSCAYVVAPTPDPGTPLEQTLWHEVAHSLGLYHTSEPGGDSFDAVEDTSECRVEESDTDADELVAPDECDDGDNLMFWTGDSGEITAGQAFVLRTNPLFGPVGR